AWHGSSRQTQPVSARTMATGVVFSRTFAGGYFEGLAGFGALLPAQFVHEVLEARRKTRPLGTQALLQVFTHRFADRPARVAVDCLGAVAILHEFRLDSARIVGTGSSP